MTVTFKRLSKGRYAVLRDGAEVGQVYSYRGRFDFHKGRRETRWAFVLGKVPPPMEGRFYSLEELHQRAIDYPRQQLTTEKTYREVKEWARQYLALNPQVEAVS